LKLHVTCLLLSFATGIFAADSSASDVALKAAFVYNFSKYTEWPPDTSGGSLVLCLHNVTPAQEQAFAPLNGRMANSKAVQLRVVDSNGETGGCHVIFFGKGTQRAVIDKTHARAAPLLSVGDSEEFIEAGGIIALVERDNRLQFDINLAAARRANLKISAQLLKLAYKIRDDDKISGAVK
jgi:hypothetical protein